MSLKTRAILVLVIGTILGLGVGIGGDYLARQRIPTEDEINADRARLLAEVIARVRSDYVEPIDEAELMERAIRSMVADLDEHSAFLDVDEYQDIRIGTTGRYSGVGLEIGETDERVLVITPIDGTPAQRAGILPGDEIVAVDGVLLPLSGSMSLADRLRGPAGSTVQIDVQRGDYDDPLQFNLTRQRIKVASTRHQLLDPDIGYLRLSQFIETTEKEARASIEALLKNELAGVIVDLRNNPGGMLNSAVAISDLFLDDGVIVSASGRSAESRFTRNATPGDLLDGRMLVVLVNGGSASASEIVAAALQDHQRATVVGTRTFGKGLVQSVMPLSRGRAIKLTTSRYFTPSGESINDVGVSPDVFVQGARGYPDQSLNGRLDRERDTQLAEAIALIRAGGVLHTRAPD